MQRKDPGSSFPQIKVSELVSVVFLILWRLDVNSVWRDCHSLETMFVLGIYPWHVNAVFPSLIE